MSALAWLAIAATLAAWFLTGWTIRRECRRDEAAYTAAIAALDPAARQALWDEHCAGVPGLEDARAARVRRLVDEAEAARKLRAELDDEAAVAAWMGLA